MRSKRAWTFALAAFSIVAAACVCTSALPFGGGGVTAPIDLGPAVELTVSHQDAYGGVSMSFPAGWTAESLFGIIVASEDAAFVDIGGEDVFESFTSPAVIAFVGPLEDFDLPPGATVDDLAEDQIGSALEDESINFSAAEDVTVAGYPGLAVTFDGTNPDTGQDLAGRMVVVLTDQQAGSFIGIAPQEQWGGFARTFDAIIDSVSFFAPDPSAFEEELFGEDFGEDTVVEPEAPTEPTSSFTLNVGGSGEAVLEEADAHDWTFQGSAGQTITVSVAPGSEEFDPVLALIGPDGSTIVEVDNGFSGEGEVLTTTLPVDGAYSARVTAFAFLGGPYTISVGEGLSSAQVVGTLTFGAPQSSALDDGSTDDWLFSGTAGQTVTVTVSPDAGDLDAVLAVIGPDGSQLGPGEIDDGFSGEDEVLSLSLPTNGDYLVRVRGFAGGGGPYTVRVSSP